MAKKYIDAEKLKAEIERLKKENGKDGRPSNVAEMLYSHFLSLITSLQQEQPGLDLASEIEAAMKWLREMYNLHILSVPYPHEDGVFYWAYKIAFLDFDTLAVMVTKKAAGFDTYEQACEAAIKYCLENLI